MASSVAQAQGLLTEQQAVAYALDANPLLRAAMLDYQRAHATEVGEGGRYGFYLLADGTLNIGNTPTLSGRGVTFPGIPFTFFQSTVQLSYVESAVVGTTLRRTTDFGMTVDLRAQGTRLLRGGVFTPGVPPATIGPALGFDASLTVTQPLWRGFGDRNGATLLRQARIDRDRTDGIRLRTASELVRDTTVAYWEMWYSSNALDVQRGARDLAGEQLGQARSREELGALAHPDMLAFATQRATAEENVALAEADLAARALEVGRLMGSEQPPLGIDTRAPPTPPERNAAAVATAIAHSPQIQELRAAVALAQEQARTAGAALEPRVDLQGQLAVHGWAIDDAGGAFSQFGSFAAVTGLLQLNFELPLEDTQRNMQVEAANLAARRGEQQLAAAQQQISAQVRTLLQQAAAARHRIDLADQTQAVATELMNAEQQRFSAGATTAIAVTQAQNQLRDAQLRGLRARVDLFSADVQLAHLTGTLLDPASVH